MGEETVTSLEKSANQGDGGLMPLENNLAQVGIHASFTLKGERVKSIIFWSLLDPSQPPEGMCSFLPS